jgi:hypothetical protein
MRSLNKLAVNDAGLMGSAIPDDLQRIAPKP